jgi:hypothetical protein
MGTCLATFRQCLPWTFSHMFESVLPRPHDCALSIQFAFVLPIEKSNSSTTQCVRVFHFRALSLHQYILFTSCLLKCALTTLAAETTFDVSDGHPSADRHLQPSSFCLQSGRLLFAAPWRISHASCFYLDDIPYLVRDMRWSLVFTQLMRVCSNCAARRQLSILTRIKSGPGSIESWRGTGGI